MSSPSYEPARCPVCGHADAIVVAEQDDLKREVELLWEFHERRLRPGTPTERLMDRVAFSEHPPLRLVRCRECGLVYRNPVERTHELHAIYAREAPTADVLRTLHDVQLPAVREQARVLRRVLGRGGSGLEVGSYVGAFLRAARDEGMQFEGIDINADVNVFTRSLGLVVHDGELASFDETRRFDAIAIWNTFDQLADPRGVVIAAAKRLAAGGVLVVRVPNGAFYARMRRRLDRGKGISRMALTALAHNNLLTFPYRWGFDPRSLVRLLSSAGLEATHVRGDVLVPIADEWTKPWARVEERLVKRGLAMSARNDPTRAPWFEVYATKRAST